jgi:hypothetical protein
VGEAAGPPVRTLDRIQTHARVVRRLARRADAMLPARFSTIVADERELRRLVRTQRRFLRSALQLVAGREQMTLRLVGAGEALETLARTRRARAPGAGARHLRERARALKGEVEAPELAPLRAALSGLVRAERIRRLPRGPGVVAYHLIDRGTSARYRRLVSSAGRGTTPVVGGPFPPYAFACEWLE